MALPKEEIDIKKKPDSAEPTVPKKKSKSFLRKIGPGLITGAADDDPSGIGTYSIAGAQFGYNLLWLTPVCLPLMIAVQEMCGRLAAITGEGLAAVIKKHYPRWVLWGSVALLIGANTINIWADLNIMAASAKMLFGLPTWLWLTAITGVTLVLQVYVPYRTYVKFLKWLALALLAYVITAFLPKVHLDWGEVGRNLFKFHWSSNPDFIMTVVGFIGTTISPYLFFWQANQTVEEEVAEGTAAASGMRLKRVTEDEIRAVRSDTIIGMVASQIVTFFIVICSAATLHKWGITKLDTAQDAAQALLPLGISAYWLFTLGIIGTGMLAVPTLAGSAAYAVSETVGWRTGLYRRFHRAKGFYLTIGIVIIVSYLLNFVHSISPVKGLFYSAVLNGVVAPPLIVLLLFMCNNKNIVGERRNNMLSNVLGWITVVLMTAAAGYMFWAMATGKAS
jgi:NRAMP (natural resistance-associated macrophage protein)-like metal ion transporter